MRNYVVAIFADARFSIVSLNRIVLLNLLEVQRRGVLC
jgi:hypothetical protein